MCPLVPTIEQNLVHFVHGVMAVDKEQALRERSYRRMEKMVTFRDKKIFAF